MGAKKRNLHGCLFVVDREVLCLPRGERERGRVHSVFNNLSYILLNKFTQALRREVQNPASKNCLAGVVGTGD